MSSTLHALTEKIDLIDTDEFYLVQNPYTTGHDRRVTLANLKKHFAKNIAAAGTLTASSPAGISQTWDNPAVAFVGFRIDITDTASDPASYPFDIRIGGSQLFRISRAVGGANDGLQFATIGGNAAIADLAHGTVDGGYVKFTNGLYVGRASIGGDIMAFGAGSVVGANVLNSFPLGFYSDVGATELSFLHAEATNVIAQRRGTNAQILRSYRTFTNTTNYERQAWQSGAGYFEWAAETAGTGTDNIDLQITPAGTGRVRFGTHTAIGAETVTGYITIKDSGGTERKVAVVS